VSGVRASVEGVGAAGRGVLPAEMPREASPLGAAEPPEGGRDQGHLGRGSGALSGMWRGVVTGRRAPPVGTILFTEVPDAGVEASSSRTL
jgi:hypothetical protein